MSTDYSRTSRPFFSPTGRDATVRRVNLFHDLSDGLKGYNEIDLTDMGNVEKLLVKSVVHGSTSKAFTTPATITVPATITAPATITDQATAALLRRQSFQAVDKMLEKLVDRTASQSIMNRLADLKEEADFCVAKLTKNREVERLEGNAAEILRCIRDCVTLATTEEFCRPVVVSDLRDTLQKLSAKAVIEPLDVKAFRASLRQRKLPFNKLLLALKEEVNKYDYSAVQIDDPIADEIQQ